MQVAAETMVDDAYAVTGNALDVITAPGAPSHVTATRGETYAGVSFDPATVTGSSAWPSTDADGQAYLEYTITLHDTTDPSQQDVVRENVWDTEDLWVGDDPEGSQAPLVPGDAYTVSVTATNPVVGRQVCRPGR